MGWFGTAFLIAFVIALVTGKAYHRGMVDRREHPGNYWIVVGAYFFLATVGYTMPLLKSLPEMPSLELLFTDSATRLAYDIEAGFKHLRRMQGDRYTIEHIPLGSPSGCAEDFKLQLDADIIVVWCKTAATGEITSSYLTSYHSRFVTMPKSFMLDKRAGQHVFIDLQAGGNKAVITKVY